MAGEDQRVRCVACDGRGWNEHEHTMVRYAEFRVIGQTCPICRGAGLVSLERPPILDVAKWWCDQVAKEQFKVIDEWMTSEIARETDRADEPPGTGEQMPKTRREWLGAIADLCAAEVWDDRADGCGCPGVSFVESGCHRLDIQDGSITRAFGGWFCDEPMNHHRAMLAAIELWAAEPE